MPESPAELPAASLLHEALAMLTAALDLIDRAEAPADIGAHVDLAVQRLAQVLGTIAPAADIRPF